MQQEYDDWSTHWKMFAKASIKNPAQHMRHKLIIDAICMLNDSNFITPPPHLDIILDIGSGQGDFLSKAMQRCIANTFIGFEVSSEGVYISKSNVPQAKFFQIDMLNLPTDDIIQRQIGLAMESAKIITCIDVLEHVDDPVLFCCNIKRFLQPGGMLLVTVPGGPMSAFDKYIGHRAHFTRDSIKNVLELAGFSVCKVNMAGFPFFNLYRLLVILRGKSLIHDINSQPSSFKKETFTTRLAYRMMHLFNWLFQYNKQDSSFGWQVFAIATKLN